VPPDSSAATLQTCGGCGTEVPASFVDCPSCHRLVHAVRLNELAQRARAAEAASDPKAALLAWQTALTLLPVASIQHETVAATIQRLTAALGPATESGTPARQGRAKWMAGLGAMGALAAKFKWAVLLLLGKGKLLLVGLTQVKTVLSMAVALGVYTMAYGWKFAAGLIASIYVHEMGHVAWLRRYGIPASAPMFVPGLGAFVRLKSHPATPAQDARVGLAGPVWGAAAAVVCLAIGSGGGWPTFMAIARVGAWINLFNLIPVWQLDGGRGFAALSRSQRGWAAGVLWLLALVGHDGMLFLLAIGATVRAFGAGAPVRGDRQMFALYLALVAGLTALIACTGGSVR
jgi:Zn-dependent protease